MHAHRHIRAGLARQGGFPIDPGRSTPSVALGHLPHTHQGVRPRPQHQFLQRPNLSPVLLPRRLEDPAPQPRYVLLMGTPIDHVPVHDSDVLGSVHRDGVQLAPMVRETTGPQFVQRLTCPCQHPHRSDHIKSVSGQLCRDDRRRCRSQLSRVSRCLSATGLRVLGILSRRGIPSLSRSTYPKTPMASMFPGPRRGFHVPHTRYATGLGALFTPRPRGAHPSGRARPDVARPLCQGPGPVTPVTIPSTRS
jgi:hypothetical protein